MNKKVEQYTLVAKEIGKAVRSLRKERGITLNQLSSDCGLSQPYLSQVENGKVAASIKTLHKIAESFQISVQHFMYKDDEYSISLVRGKSNPIYESWPNTGLQFLVKGKNHNMEPNLITAEPGSSSERLTAIGEKFIFVLSGRIYVKLKHQRKVTLGPGDSYCFPASIPHEWAAVGEDPVQFIIVSSPPSF